MTCVHTSNKASLKTLREAMYDFEERSVRAVLSELIADDASVHMPFPFGDLKGPDALYETCYAPLFNAIPDLERREMITMAGTTPQGQDWVGIMGYYLGSFLAPWLGLLPTGHLTHMRFHEFYRLEEGKVTEMQAIWDIPEVMVQANAWPMAPQLGAFL